MLEAAHCSLGSHSDAQFRRFSWTGRGRLLAVCVGWMRDRGACSRLRLATLPHSFDTAEEKESKKLKELKL